MEAFPGGEEIPALAEEKQGQVSSTEAETNQDAVDELVHNEDDLSDEVLTPPLPDEMLLKIFRAVPPGERGGIALTSKHFRQLDLSIFDKYFSINLTWERDWQRAKGRLRNDEKWTDVLHGDGESPIKATYGNVRAFRNAQTHILNIQYKMKNCDADSADLTRIASLLNTVIYKELKLVIVCNQDCAQAFFPAFLTDRNLENEIVLIQWIGLDYPSLEVDQFRESLKALPTINMLRLEFIHSENDGLSTLSPKVTNTYNLILDDAMLLHFTANTNHVELPRGDYTVEAVFNAFETICESVEAKFVSMLVTRPFGDEILVEGSKKFVRKDIRGAENIRGENARRLVDHGRRGVMQVLRSDERFDDLLVLRMYKMDAKWKWMKPIYWYFPKPDENNR